MLLKKRTGPIKGSRRSGEPPKAGVRTSGTSCLAQVGAGLVVGHSGVALMQ